MSVCFWGINLNTFKKRDRAKQIVLYSVLNYEAYYDEPQIAEQLSVMFPNNEIHIHFVKWEDWEYYEKTEKLKPFKQV